MVLGGDYANVCENDFRKIISENAKKEQNKY